jgi:hypothetical protein
MNTHTLSRRTIVGAAASLPAASLPAVAAALEPDPIYAAIEARKQTQQRHEDFCVARRRYQGSHRQPNGMLPDDERNDWFEEQSMVASFAERDATISLFSTKPATIAGAVALLKYVLEIEIRDPDFLEVSDDDDRPGYVLLLTTLLEAFKRHATA